MTNGALSLPYTQFSLSHLQFSKQNLHAMLLRLCEFEAFWLEQVIQSLSNDH